MDNAKWSSTWKDNTGEIMNVPQPRSRAELDDLMVHWYADATSELEDAPGFEAQRDELAAFRRECEEIFEAAADADFDSPARCLGLTRAGAVFVFDLLKRIELL